MSYLNPPPPLKLLMLYTNTHICVLHNKRIMIYQCHDCMLSLILIVAQNSPPSNLLYFKKRPSHDGKYKVTEKRAHSVSHFFSTEIRVLVKE